VPFAESNQHLGNLDKSLQVTVVTGYVVCAAVTAGAGSQYFRELQNVWRSPGLTAGRSTKPTRPDYRRFATGPRPPAVNTHILYRSTFTRELEIC